MSDLPQSVWSGSFHLYGVEVKCHTLSDGQRIIEGESLNNLMDAMNVSESMTIEAGMHAFAMWKAGR